MAISWVKKRDGRIVRFNPEKIENAIRKAFISVQAEEDKVSKILAQIVVKKIKRKIPSVEYIQNLVIETLYEEGYSRIGEAYEEYRQERSKARELRQKIGIKDELKLSVNAINVLQRRYLLRNNKGEVIETPQQMFRRVARAVAKAESKDRKEKEDEFYNVMAKQEFLPNSPALMNSGASFGQLAGCFVLPIEDSIRGIFETLKNMAIIQQSGGGTGFSFTRIRPKGSIVSSTKNPASGPVSFIKVYNAATEAIKQGGRRRGANIGVLNIDHPDIVEFINSKRDKTSLSNFNISVGITEKFMEAYAKGSDFRLIDPHTGKEWHRIEAKLLFDQIVGAAWETGDPGLLFLDRINRENPTPALGRIESTNPCGETDLLPYESCVLGSINLSKIVKGRKIQWSKLRNLVRTGVNFLDNIVTVNRYPLKEIEKITKGNRKIGLGVMGYAEMLIKLGIPYDSKEAIKTAKKIARFIRNEAEKKSEELADEKGEFPNFKKSILKKRRRNATLMSIAPTGTISLLAGTSSGIEPLFAIAFTREILEGTKMKEINPLFREIAISRGFYKKHIIDKIRKKGSIQNIKGIPSDVKKLFKTSMDISPEWHVRTQAAFQQYTDNSVSKTVNLPETATRRDIKRIFLLAYKLKCKGITVYRYGSKKHQTLTFGEEVKVHPEYAGGCPSTECAF